MNLGIRLIRGVLILFRKGCAKKMFIDASRASGLDTYPHSILAIF